MQEFRPATMIAADTELAGRYAQGEPAAVRELVDRYAATVSAAIAAGHAVDERADALVEIFVAAHRDPLEPGDEFGPWLAGHARARTGAVDERRWVAAAAVAAVDPNARDELRQHHLDGLASSLDDELARHELRLRRRLAHLGEPDAVVAALSDSAVWDQPDPGIAERVLDAIADEPAQPVPDEPVPELSVEPAPPSRVSRGLRPVLFGLGGAVLVLFVAIIGLSAASGTPESPDFTVELTPTGALVDVDGGEITVTERDAGIEIELEAFTLPRRAGGLYYEARLVLRDGGEISAGTFAQGDGVTLWAGTSLDDVEIFRIVIGDLDDTAVDDVVLKADLPAG